MQRLLMPAAELLAMDATDSSCGDTFLKEAKGDVSMRAVMTQTFVVN